MHPALLYVPGDRLSLPELIAARLDGHLVEVGAAYMPADTVEEADARAAGIAAGIPPRMGVCGPTAAWIHGAGLDAPPVHHVRRLLEGRFRPGTDRSVIIHEPWLGPDEATQIGGLVVATPTYTGLELALGASTHPTYAAWLHRLLETMPEIVDTLRETVRDLPRRPGRTQARRLLEEPPVRRL